MVRVPISKSRSANGVTPRAAPSTDTLAPLGDDLTRRLPTVGAAAGADADGAAPAGGGAADGAAGRSRVVGAGGLTFPAAASRLVSSTAGCFAKVSGAD